MCQRMKGMVDLLETKRTGPGLASMTDFDSDEGLARFERSLLKMGVEKKLRALGAVEGDTVRIGSYEFTYS